jgi:hypothetical protein
VLALLIADARNYWQGIKGAGVDLEQAFDDVTPLLQSP